VTEQLANDRQGQMQNFGNDKTALYIDAVIRGAEKLLFLIDRNLLLTDAKLGDIASP
jgi:hypothetical protein